MSANQQANGSNENINNNDKEWDEYFDKMLTNLERKVEESEEFGKAQLEAIRYNVHQSYLRNLENYKFDE